MEPNVIGYSVNYTDRDERPSFNVPSEKPKKTKFELRREMDEKFENFKTVLLGKDVDLADKQKVIITLLDNYKSSDVEISSRSKGLLLDLYTDIITGR